ncbi:hypothetical protein NLI96_g7081 [Meripilus lineatus]|uniref:Uncharacterized protein n=1 Tax=Meripilus lineatus TaxID=2056292 RepID=A0AAD5UZT4_9APHY|nr:hypothetical protein NLI96_g7081 [Physisporinus lineatus]
MRVSSPVRKECLLTNQSCRKALHTIAACFLIPLGVAIYIVVGGMRSTFICDYTHTTVLFAIIFVFVISVYATPDNIASPAAMYALLTNVSEAAPVSGNDHGSYVTIRSKKGLIFGVINVIENFATVFQNQAVCRHTPFPGFTDN